MTSTPAPGGPQTGPTGRGFGGNAPIEDAAWLILGAGLRNESSPLDPAVVTWDRDTATDLLSRIGTKPAGGAFFAVNIRQQLIGASRPVQLLAAELLYLHCLPLVDLRPGTKLERVMAALEGTDPPVSLSPVLLEALQSDAVFRGGNGFSARIWRQLGWLCQLVITSTQATPAVRSAALSDPWAFRDFLATVPEGEHGIRYSIQYLAWPGWFEPIVSRDHRQRIYDTFRGNISGPATADDETIDRGLYQLRSALQVDRNSRDWYYEPWYSQWSPTSGPVGQRAWLVKERQAGTALAGWSTALSHSLRPGSAKSTREPT